MGLLLVLGVSGFLIVLGGGLWGFGLLAETYVSAFLTSTFVERGDLEGARRAVARGSDPGLPADGVNASAPREL